MSAGGGITISGPGVDRSAPTVGSAISGATTFACRAHEPVTFYVREKGEVVARVERDADRTVRAITVKGVK